MLNSLTIYNMPPTDTLENNSNDLFQITTCQRTLLVGIDQGIKNLPTGSLHAVGSEAYGFLLETITGLKSQFPAENEIVCQFRDAFKIYLKKNNRNNKIIHILEKLFKDNKEIRSKHLRNIGQHSYAGITRKILLKKRTNNKVLILGSGNLATGLLKLLSKKFNITISARNSEKTKELNKLFNFETTNWGDFDYYKNYPNIISTIGAYKTYFHEDFFTKWKQVNQDQGIFIDLGSPSTISTNQTINNGVYRLYNIYNECEILTQEKELQIINAKTAIKDIVDRRIKYFKTSSQLSSKECVVGI